MYSSEFIGTFIFVFSILCITSIDGLNHMQTAISVGLALVISILATLGLNKESKAHLNPAVSAAFYVKGDGDMNFGSLITLIVMQVFAGLLALGLFRFIKANDSKTDGALKSIIDKTVN